MSSFLIILLFASKLFYVNIFAVGDFNFTLSDMCLVICLWQLWFTKQRSLQRDSGVLLGLRSMVVMALVAALLNCISTIVMGTQIIGSIMNLIKRWLSLLIIPSYIYRCVTLPQRKKIIAWIMVIVVLYTIINFKNITSSESERFTADGTANPNVVAGLFGVLLIHLIHSEYKRPVKIGLTVLSCLMILACSSRGGILAVAMGFTYWLWTNKNLIVEQKVRIVVGVVLLVAMCLPVGNWLFPAATQRIIDSFTGGLRNTTSYQMRMTTFWDMIEVMLSDVQLLFFGTGFGNGNLQLEMARHYLFMTTADNMFGNLFGWCGLLGLPWLVMYFRHLWNMGKMVERAGFPALFLLTMYMVALGFSQDAMFEPTVGCLYFIFTGLELIQYADGSIKQQEETIVRKESVLT